MSTLVLRNLMPEGTSYQSKIDSPVLKGLGTNSPLPELDNISSLSRLDSLKLSSSQNAKGRVPIQLLSPDDMGSGSSHTNKASGGSNRLASLTSFGNTEKTSHEPKKLNSLGDISKNSGTSTVYSSNYTVSSSTNYSQTNGNKKIIGSQTSQVSGSFTFVDGPDKTMDKINTAVEKIENWDRKIRALNTLVSGPTTFTSESAKNAQKNAVASGTGQLDSARGEAIDARKEALEAYEDAINDLKSKFKATGFYTNNPYLNDFNNMESFFKSTEVKDKTTMQKVVSYTKLAFNITLDYANPFSY